MSILALRSIKNLIFLLFPILLLGLVSFARASVGAGVGIGEIKVTERLAPGGVYLLPSWPVINTGDTKANFKLLSEGVDPNWISFSENNLNLTPNESRMIKAYVSLPLTAQAGTYNVYLENQVVPSGPVGIGPTAATKLRFIVGDGKGVLGAATQRFYSVYTLNKRLILMLFLLADLAIVYFVVKRYFKVSFKLEAKKDGKDKVNS